MRWLGIGLKGVSADVRRTPGVTRGHPVRWLVGLLVIGGCCVGQSPALAENVEITVLLVGDTHAHLSAGGPRTRSLEGTGGGIARAVTVIERERAADPDLLLLHAGDTFVGSLVFNHSLGVAELAILDEVGVDAMAVGNHELDLGPQSLAVALATAGVRFPLVAANLDTTGYPALGAWAAAAVVREAHGVRIGVFGLTVPGDPLSRPDPVVVLPDLIGIAQREVDRLRNEGADVVLCLSHLGTAHDIAVASNVVGIDAILGGHDHLTGDLMWAAGPDGSSTPIVHAGSFWRHVRLLRLVWNGSGVSSVSSILLDVDDTVPPDPQIAAVVTAIMDDVEERWPGAFSLQVATTATPLGNVYDPHQRMRDTDMANLVADALRWRTGTDIALIPKGLVAEGLARGPVVPEDLFRTVPYGFDPATGLDFALATFDIAGQELVRGLEFGLSVIEQSDDFLVQVSGVRYRYDSSEPVGERIEPGSVHVNGRPLDPLATYSATANLGVVSLLPMAGVEISNVEILADVEFYALREYTASLGVVTRPPGGRIRDMAVPPRVDGWRPEPEGRALKYGGAELTRTAPR